MKLGELFIELGITGDIRPLKKALSGMDAASIKSKLLKKYLKDLKNATSDVEKATIKQNFAQKINALRTTENAKAITGLIGQVTKMIGIAGAAAIAFDRLGNSVLKANQLYINFGRQTGIPINRLNKMIGVAKLSGMNLPAEQVAGDLASLQQKIFKLGITGEGSGIFAQLGINPMGMDSDKFLTALRQRFKGMSEMQKSYVLDELGLSREWLNVLNLSNQEFEELVKQSKDLQLSAEERKQLAKYTLIQQKNNMRWELAKQKLAIALLPIITKIMEATSKIAISIENAFGNEHIIAALTKMSVLMAAIAVQAGLVKKAFSFLGAFSGFKALGGLLGLGAGKSVAKTVGKTLGKRAALMAGGAALGPVGWIIDLILGVWTIVDILNFFTKKEEKKEDELPVDDSGLRYQYHNINSNMTNNFYNNPVPQATITNDLDNVLYRYMAGTKR